MSNVISDEKCNLIIIGHLGKFNPHRIFGMMWYNVVLSLVPLALEFFEYQNRNVVGNIIQLIEKVHLDDLDLYVITFIALATSVLLWSSVLKLTKKFNSTS